MEEQPQPAPQFVPGVPNPAAPTTPAPINISPKPKSHLIIVVLIAILLLLGAGAYAYFEKLGPFSNAPYTESNLMSGLLKKSAEINSGAYLLSLSLYTEPRDNDATAFNLKIKDGKELKEKYFRDYTRAQNIRAILQNLRYNSGKQYPQNLSDMAKPAYKSIVGKVDLNDPLTGAQYEYSQTEGGKNFALKVTFETTDAISNIELYKNIYKNGSSTAPTIIEGQTVTFTKDSQTYFYLQNKPPKPFIQTISEYTNYLPPDIKINGSISSEGDFGNEGVPAQWKFALDGSGDFGDLTYKVNAEALKKDDDYYFRINNIPSFFSAYMPPKGQWIKVSPRATTTSAVSSYYGASYLKESFQRSEKKYLEQKKAATELARKITEIADENKLFEFKNPPSSDRVDGRSLYKYELRVRKEAILPFYKKAAEEISKSSAASRNIGFKADPGLINFLESEEFSETYDYYDKNVNMTLWVDDNGYPAIFEYSMRVVPPDESVTLKDKQVKAIFRIALDRINEKINVEAPKDAKTMEEIWEGSDQSGSVRLKAKSAAMKSNLMSLLPAAIVYGDDHNSSYGPQAIPPGPCRKVAGTFLSDENVWKYLSAATDNDPSKATCALSAPGTDQSFAISVPSLDDPDYSFCVDSSGYSKEIIGAVKKSSCN